MVLDRIVSAAREETGNGGPTVTVSCVGSEDDFVLLGRERASLYGGAELVAPP